MTLDFQQFCAVISELEGRNSHQARETDKYNANNFGNLSNFTRIWISTKSAFDNCLKKSVTFVLGILSLESKCLVVFLFIFASIRCFRIPYVNWLSWNGWIRIEHFCFHQWKSNIIWNVCVSWI